ncbi:hypothetical protein JWE36_20010, partial [Acinetobacter baumannii]
VARVPRRGATGGAKLALPVPGQHGGVCASTALVAPGKARSLGRYDADGGSHDAPYVSSAPCGDGLSEHEWRQAPCLRPESLGSPT